MAFATKFVLALLAVFALILIVSAESPEEARARVAAESQKCADAMTSLALAPIVTYSDKVAYDAKVAEACKSFDLDKLKR